jgi:hypothetical protein
MGVYGARAGGDSTAAGIAVPTRSAGGAKRCDDRSRRMHWLGQSTSSHGARAVRADRCDHPCKIDKTNVSGPTVSWSWSCTTADATVHSEGVVHYHGHTLDGEITVRTSTPGHPPIERSHPLMGRYLGPCDGN